MKLGIYSVRDCKSNSYGVPTVSISDEIAARQFEHAVKTSGTILTSFRGDFSLIRIGYMDDEKGTVIPCDHEIVLDGSSVPEDKK